MDGPATLELPDGRQLAYETYGRQDGHPVVCAHGLPGSRLCWTLFDDIAQERDLRLIAPDRPGFGRSDPEPGRRLADWPADVAALADHLGHDEFAVVGFSAGGPHALACQALLGDRVTDCALVSPVGPPDAIDVADGVGRQLAQAGGSIPGLTRGVFGAAGWLARHWRPRFRAALETSASEHDRALFRQPAGDLLVEDAVEGVRTGGRGAAHEFPMLAGDWGFDVDAVEAPVGIWHGRDDHLVSLDSATALADRLPAGAIATPPTGHYSTLVHYGDAVLTAVAAPDPAADAARVARFDDEE